MLSKKSLRDETLKNHCRIVFKLAHSRSMWLTVSGRLQNWRLQNWHVGRSSPVRRCKCVRRVWPIHSLLMTTASRRDRFLVWNTTNVWVNSMKLVTLTTVPDILPFFQAELWNARNVFSCWNFHFGNRESKSRLGCGVSLLITWYIYMTWYPADNYSFTTFCKVIQSD